MKVKDKTVRIQLDQVEVDYLIDALADNHLRGAGVTYPTSPIIDAMNIDLRARLLRLKLKFEVHQPIARPS